MELKFSNLNADKNLNTYVDNRLTVKIKNFIDDRIFTSKYNITDKDIDMAGESLDKMIKIIDSCIYSEQLFAAEKYLELYSEKFPFTVIIEQIIKRKIYKKMHELQHLDLDWYNKELDEFLLKSNNKK